jgi:uncharacterized protein with HEPN domain
MAFDAFAQDRKTVNAVVRSLEVLGEAAKRIPCFLKSPFIIPNTYEQGKLDLVKLMIWTTR